MAWQRAANMARLEQDGKTVYRGVVVYAVGDLEHAENVSDHNPDDTTLPQGGRAAQSDADSRQEVRALDFMRGPNFSHADALEFVAALRDPRSIHRLFYIIYDRRIYRRDGSNSPYTGDNPHTDHVHVSGWAADDENAAPWVAVLERGQDMQADERAALLDIQSRMNYVDGRVEAIFNDRDATATGFKGAGNTNYNKARLNAIETAAKAPSTVAVDQDALDAAVRNALLDPAVLGALATAINNDAARRLAE